MKTKKIIHTGIVITLALGGLTAACASTRPIDQQIDDSNLTTSIGAKYALDSEIDRYRIDIDTINGVVTLRGSVADAEQRSDAERIARSTEGVRDVVNDLEVEAKPRTADSTFADSWIVTMINSKLIVDPEVRSRNIDVDVREGVVTLSGIVESNVARTEAEDLAKSVDGVVEVVNEIQVGG